MFLIHKHCLVPPTHPECLKGQVTSSFDCNEQSGVQSCFLRRKSNDEISSVGVVHSSLCLQLVFPGRVRFVTHIHILFKMLQMAATLHSS